MFGPRPKNWLHSFLLARVAVAVARSVSTNLSVPEAASCQSQHEPMLFTTGSAVEAASLEPESSQMGYEKVLLSAGPTTFNSLVRLFSPLSSIEECIAIHATLV